MFIINGNFVKPPEGLIVKNWIQDGEPRFSSRGRTKPLLHLVLHETGGNTASGCKKTLIKKNSGVHYIVGRDGIISCHGDPILDRMVHANQLNDTSIGIEFVNPYAPQNAGFIPYNTIPAEWWTWCPDKNNLKYVLPSVYQIKVLEILVPFLCKECNIPYEFPTKDLNAKNQQVKKTGILGKRIPESGVIAHRDFSKHSDGRYLLEHLIKKEQNV
jgi:hypothetical protein